MAGAGHKHSLSTQRQQAVQEQSLSPWDAHQDNDEDGWGQMSLKLPAGTLAAHGPGPLGPIWSPEAQRSLQGTHLLGPLHQLALSEELIGVVEEDAQFLLDQGDGYLGHGQVGHLRDDIGHTARPFHNHTGGPVGDGVVDGLQQSGEVGPDPTQTPADPL